MQAQLETFDESYKRILNPHIYKVSLSENLKDLKKETGMTVKQIAEKTNLPERTVSRIFSGETDNPYVDTLHRIVTVLGSSLDGIFADTKLVVGEENLAALQTDIDRLTNELTLANAELAVMRDKVCNLTAENEILRLKLEHKEELLALHNYYMKIKTNEERLI